MHPITAILLRGDGDPMAAAEELVPLLYSELRQLARGLLASRPAGQTLQPTALVHEAYLRLADSPRASWESRQQFFSAAARAMRNILVDQARRKAARKRGGDRARVPVDDVGIEPPDENLLALDEALDRLERDDPRKGQIVMLRYFSGLTESETAEVLGISRATVAREWSFIRLWLFREIHRE